MDTVTQLTLGAAVGEAVLGTKIGNKAAFWGAALGVMPDLDVLASPFVSEVQALAIHRGITHSLFFVVAVAPILGWVLHRYVKGSASWKQWLWLVFWVVLTHIFIDVCTSYGTQVFQPFSNYSLSFNSIFIIDPLYTLPLLGGVITALFLNRHSKARSLANWIGIGISTFYLLLGFGIKHHVNNVFQENFVKQNIAPEQFMTTPSPLNILLWNGYAESQDTLYVGLYSVFDDNRQIEFKSIPQNKKLLKPFDDQLPVERLIWFSRGYYAADKIGSELIVHDLRFGRSDLWLTDGDAPFVWNYRLEFNGDSTRVTGFEQFEPSFDMRTEMWNRLFKRMVGQK
ncbi:metal-dependent hydrolase [Fodinibius sp. Rm-B-1B1-1]|uniref:metal-dependent hydrolase n=1 Tax=Fodinibius alkaliphilus TaxID=3140241 RepID=UPI003159FB16